MRFWHYVALAVILGLISLVSSQIYVFYVREQAAARDFAALGAKLEAAQAEEQKLRKELEYLSRPENLEKEIRSRFNYRKEGEKLIILVPASTSSPANPTSSRP
ncbi:MAG: septum formation initiator family protein [Candidatus Liptonbacteria bacterium]|nr:septum formation initiator family protein [Candidatus Liptonbacteria bacterium]